MEALLETVQKCDARDKAELGERLCLELQQQSSELPQHLLAQLVQELQAWIKSSNVKVG